MATTTLGRKFYIGIGIASVFVAALVLYAYFATPPFFVQMGKHFFSGTSIFAIGQIYRCEPPQTWEECSASQTNLLAVVSSDPDPRNWWPVVVDFTPFD